MTNKKYRFNYFIILLIFHLAAQVVSAQVTKRDSTISWKTYSHTIGENLTLDAYSLDPADMVDTTFNTIILENEFLKVTLLPEYGGRILSMIYKPTGNEELYQNPVGAPYGWWWTGTFYYNWLMIYGGIFPTLTEPEHGKAWFLPWEASVVKETTDTISIKMTWADTIGFTQYSRYGETDMSCDFIVTLTSGSSALETEVVLHNHKNEVQNYEYWTNTGLSPGSSSEPYQAAATAGAKLVIPAPKLKIPSWAGIKNLEDPVPGEPGNYYFENLREFKNWTYSGSAFSRPALKDNYWGVINQDNNEGIIRISDNVETPYVKIWTFGYGSTQIDPFNPPTANDLPSDNYYLRPFIELWAGVSSEFNVPAQIGANETKSWKEYYTPTVGLENVNFASKEVVADFRFDKDDQLIKLNVFNTTPTEGIWIYIGVKSFHQYALYAMLQPVDMVNGNYVEVSLLENYEYNEGDSLVFLIEDFAENDILEGIIELKEEVIITSVNEDKLNPTEFSLNQNFPNPFNPSTTISYSLPEANNVKITIMDVLGQEVETLVNEYKPAGSYNIKFDASDLPSGVYMYRIEAGKFHSTKKMILVK